MLQIISTSYNVYVRVLNLNIWNQNYYWDRRLPLITKLLTDSGYSGEQDDLLVFHEITNTLVHDQLAEINSQLGYKYTHLFPTRPNSGIGILANRPLANATFHPLTDSTFTRIVGLIEFSDLILAATHFAIDAPTQLINTKECLSILQHFSTKPIVICADLNCAPSEPPVQLLSQAGFADVWHQLGQPEFASWPTDPNLVIQNHLLKNAAPPTWPIAPRRVDYIFTKNIQASTIAKLGLNQDGLWHSDHWGLSATF